MDYIVRMIAKDAPITAMAIQALAPYYNSETTYLHPGTGNETTIREVVDQAVACLLAGTLSYDPAAECHHHDEHHGHDCGGHHEHHCGGHSHSCGEH